MDLTEEQYENIQKYLDGELSPEKERIFIEELQRSTELQRYLLFEQELRGNLEFMQEKKSQAGTRVEDNFEEAPLIKNMIKKAGQEWKQEKLGSNKPMPNHHSPLREEFEKRIAKRDAPPSISIKPWLLVALAASLVIAVGLIIWLFSGNQSSTNISGNDKDSVKTRQNNDSLKTPQDTLRHIEPPRPPVDFAGIFRRNFKADDVPERKPQLLAEALTDFKDADYETIQALNLHDLPTRGDLPDNDINNARNVRELGKYYKGLSYIETKNDKQAIENLQWVADSAANKALAAKSQWFLALIHIRQKNVDDAAALLSEVSANAQAAPYNRQAKEILKVLRNE